MNKEKKINYLEKQVRVLNDQLHDVKSENETLMQENISLKRIIEKTQENASFLESKLIEARDGYISNSNILKQKIQQYDDAISSVLLLKKKYTKEIQGLIKRIKG